MKCPWLIVLCALIGGCESPAVQQPTSSASPAPSSPPAQPSETRNACRLLTPDDVKELDPTVVLANVVTQEQSYGECNWEDKDGVVLIALKAYWSGGRQQWDTWRRAQGLGEQLLEKQEGVALDSVVKQGPVPGLGDGAYFSPLLPSLLLKRDTLVEIMMPRVKNPEAKFRPLATKLLGRI